MACLITTAQTVVGLKATGVSPGPGGKRSFKGNRVERREFGHLCHDSPVTSIHDVLSRLTWA